MARRWSVAGQLLALQLGIIAVVLVGVGGVSLAQAQIDFRRTEGARVLSAAESLAARTLLRQALSASSRPARVFQSVPIADGVQSLSGVTFVEIADADGVVVANTRDPARLGVQLSAADTGARGPFLGRRRFRHRREGDRRARPGVRGGRAADRAGGGDGRGRAGVPECR